MHSFKTFFSRVCRAFGKLLFLIWNEMRIPVCCGLAVVALFFGFGALCGATASFLGVSIPEEYQTVGAISFWKITQWGLSIFAKILFFGSILFIAISFFIALCKMFKKAWVSTRSEGNK